MPTDSDSPTSRNEKIQQLRQTLRAGQREMADWGGGTMAVSAVPGAGKSHGMATAAAIAISKYSLHPRQQLLVVTFTRSAAASIKSKIRQHLRDLSLPPGSFVVHTLHGLALNIATRHPNLSGLNLDTSSLINPNQSHRLLRTCVEQWRVKYPQQYQTLLEGKNFDGEETEKLRRQSVLRTEVLPSLAHTVVREAKSSGLLPADLEAMTQPGSDHYNILVIATGLYAQYQNLMKAKDFIDYDDMILSALRVLENEAIRKSWQKQFFAVFEDEAQDSSPLQEKLLKILARNPEDTISNLVRVGDPNQAINSTFTPADPVYFNWFCEECKTDSNLAEMNQAGRSNLKIINAANFMLQWVNQQWENKHKSDLKDLPFRLQDIHLVPRDDPQSDANPVAVGQGVEIHVPTDIYQTVELMGKRLIGLFEDDPEANAAILVRENRQGHFVAEELAYLQKDYEIKVYEVGEVERHSHIPQEIYKLLLFLHRPHSSENLKSALEVLEKRQLIPTQDLNALATLPEQFLYPSPLDPLQKPQVEAAAGYCKKLLRARLELPSYQLISFLGLTLKYTGSELATVQKLAERLGKQTAGNSALSAILTTLAEIVSSERFEGVEEENDDRYTKKGQLTIITMHKAKGLDWDYIFIPFLHADTLPGEPWIPTAAKFLGDFTLSEVARSQIRTSIHHQYLHNALPAVLPEPLAAWEEANQLKKAEEYRLLYVALTRAKRLLWLAAAQKGPFRWSVFDGNRDNFQVKQPCPAFSALKQKFASARSSKF